MTQAATAKVQYRIGGMACGFCVASIGKAIGRMPGVKSVHVNLAHEETLIEFDPGRVAPQKCELRSAGEVKLALAQGEIEIEQPGVVINMPMITWPDGHR